MRIYSFKDRHGRLVYITQERWSHIITRHPELNNKLEPVKQTVINPDIDVADNIDGNLHYFHTFAKERSMYFVVAVKYINGEAFVITAFYSKKRKT